MVHPLDVPLLTSGLLSGFVLDVPDLWMIFSRPPLTNGASLRRGNFPISSPSGGPQSWLFCPFISFVLGSMDIARGVSRWSIGSRHPVPDPNANSVVPQHWRSSKCLVLMCSR